MPSQLQPLAFLSTRALRLDPELGRRLLSAPAWLGAGRETLETSPRYVAHRNSLAATIPMRMRGLTMQSSSDKSPRAQGVRYWSWMLAPRELDCMGLTRLQDTSL